VLTNVGHLSSIHLFKTYKNKHLSTHALRQRFILKSLVLYEQQPLYTTRGNLSILLAREFNISKKNAYQYVFKELQKCLIPNQFVEEAGNVLTTKGPRILQRKGIPSYRLTKMGILVTSALEELEIKKRKELLEDYLISAKISNIYEFSVNEQLLFQLRKHPEFALQSIRQGVIKYIEGKINHPLDIIQNSQGNLYFNDNED
jgi:hypothetical protein